MPDGTRTGDAIAAPWTGEHPGHRPLETDFPFETLSEIAEIESWRKEIYRPIYHQHKWWAQRLGSVFRAMILGATVTDDSPLIEALYHPVKFSTPPVIFDPFMGSGTTIGEAHKLGCTVVGRDLNPVAHRNVRAALVSIDRTRLLEGFAKLESEVGPTISSLYRTLDLNGRPGVALYYFWVKYLMCPACATPVDLFSSYIFARHAYPKKHPTVRILCPSCESIIDGHHGSARVVCNECSYSFDPNVGPAKQTRAECPNCSEDFPIVKVAREMGAPPSHRMYAKLVLRADGVKEYCPITEFDLDAYDSAARELATLNPKLPTLEISQGNNTKQVINYGYTRWVEMFNQRQLLALSLLGRGIASLRPGHERDALMLLFSGVLEFNNMFASYKGEGTGAVRHMFSHHILKPERTPLEANVWGTPKSSGSFSTLFKSRLLRAIDYKNDPFEVRPRRVGSKIKGEKVYGLSQPIGAMILDHIPQGGLPPGSVYLSCGDSSNTDLDAGSVDAIITDPPFFDNVHYSELADFFYAWQQIYFSDKNDYANRSSTTRHGNEVQDADVGSFTAKLTAVLCECHRVLKDDGLLAFSYHHSRDDGWTSVYQAIIDSGFCFVASHPVKAELSVATPKSQSKSPINLDVILVCRKRGEEKIHDYASKESAVTASMKAAAEQIARFEAHGRSLSQGDIRVILFSQVLVALSSSRAAELRRVDVFESALSTLDVGVLDLWKSHTSTAKSRPPQKTPENAIQLNLI